MFSVAPRYPLMPPEDLAALESFPAEVIAWRGVSSTSRYQERGFSWTTDRNRAEWFAHANSWLGEPRLLEARVRRESILMYSSFERELVLDPSTRPLLATHHEIQKDVTKNRIDELHDLLSRQDEEEMALEQ